MGMAEITLRLKLFRGKDPIEQQRSRLSLLIALEALCKIDRLHLMYGTYPLLYDSGVIYQEENGTEEWPDIPSILEDTRKNGIGDRTIKWGDCEDLACWRVAELRQIFHIYAIPHIKWAPLDNGKTLYHCLVRLPEGTFTPYSFLDDEGQMIEDPSRILGMGSNWQSTANVIEGRK